MERGRNVAQEVTDRVLSVMETGTIPWQKTWLDGSYSHSTLKHYTGVNRLLLAPGEYATFLCIQREGGHVIKGSRQNIAIYQNEIHKKNDEDEPVVFFIAKIFGLYEINTQAVGITPRISQIEFESNLDAEQVISKYKEMPKVEIYHKACFSPKKNLIMMPRATLFDSMDDYYSTLFHELVHATGVPLKRFSDTVKEETLETYSREELVAELGAAFLCNYCGITSTIENTAAYIASWKQFISEDIGAVSYAAAKAEKAVNYILGKDENLETRQE